MESSCGTQASLSAFVICASGTLTYKMQRLKERPVYRKKTSSNTLSPTPLPLEFVRILECHYFAHSFYLKPPFVSAGPTQCRPAFASLPIPHIRVFNLHRLVRTFINVDYSLCFTLPSLSYLPWNRGFRDFILHGTTPGNAAPAATTSYPTATDTREFKELGNKAPPEDEINREAAAT